MPHLPPKPLSSLTLLLLPFNPSSCSFSPPSPAPPPPTLPSRAGMATITLRTYDTIREKTKKHGRPQPQPLQAPIIPLEPHCRLRDKIFRNCVEFSSPAVKRLKPQSNGPKTQHSELETPPSAPNRSPQQHPIAPPTH